MNATLATEPGKEVGAVLGKHIVLFSAILAILLLFTLIYGLLVVPWGIQPTNRSTFLPEQQSEICDKLKFELIEGETISTRYWPGFMQATTSLTVTIHGIKSRDDFLQRVHFEALSSGQKWSDEGTLYFDDYLVLNEEKPIKDYLCALSFTEKDGLLIAQIYVSGYITQFSNIYGFLYEEWQPYLTNAFFMSLLIIEFVLIIFVITLVFIYLRKKKAK